MTHSETIVGIELLLAAQGADFRRQENGGKLGKGTQVAYDLLRAEVPFVEQDVYLAPLIEQARQLVATGKIKRAVEDSLR